MNNIIILDTHVLLWSLLKSEELSTQTKQIISEAKVDAQLMISSISLWEIAMLEYKKRINVFEPITNFLDSIGEIKGLIVKDISSNIAAESTMLVDNFHSDHADRIITATAKCHGATLLTRDQKIINWAGLGHIKYLQV